MVYSSHWIAAFFSTSLSSRSKQTSLRRRVFSFSTSSCGPDIRSSCWCCWTHLFSDESPTPKSNESWGRVTPRVVAILTASRRKSSVNLFAIHSLLHSNHCSNETGTKPWQVQTKLVGLKMRPVIVAGVHISPDWQTKALVCGYWQNLQGILIFRLLRDILTWIVTSLVRRSSYCNGQEPTQH